MTALTWIATRAHERGIQSCDKFDLDPGEDIHFPNGGTVATVFYSFEANIPAKMISSLRREIKSGKRWTETFKNGFKECHIRYGKGQYTGSPYRVAYYETYYMAV